MRKYDAQEPSAYFEMPMPARSTPCKKSVNLSIDARLAAEAKKFGINMSALLEIPLNVAKAERRQAKWVECNKAAVDGWNRLVEEHGVRSDRYRD